MIESPCKLCQVHEMMVRGLIQEDKDEHHACVTCPRLRAVQSGAGHISEIASDWDTFDIHPVPADREKLQRVGL